ncbi:hypothetical protein [Pajaroellobacter abortibovis]|uniref:hypothetical protein n=1 Tax=Pajaroellobacter abortibovis TaxID=1882918 RepID=UPI0012EBB175|nr:hypothetical protein [Pajaroellobacter abortibovis]
MLNNCELTLEFDRSKIEGGTETRGQASHETLDASHQQDRTEADGTANQEDPANTGIIEANAF